VVSFETKRSSGLADVTAVSQVAAIRLDNRWTYVDGFRQVDRFCGHAPTTIDAPNRLPKLNTRVRFPLSTPYAYVLKHNTVIDTLIGSIPDVRQRLTNAFEQTPECHEDDRWTVIFQVTHYPAG
jgi:hypothetical protein